MITTARLALRQPRPDDAQASVPFWTSDRSQLMGGPLTRDQALAEWPEVTGQWARNGFGMFVLTETGGDDQPLGLVGIWYPTTHPEPELGWSLWDAAHEGRGLAREAARAARDWFFATTAHRTAISYTHPDNHRSHRLASALGATLDPLAACPYPPPVRIYRHHAGCQA